ncbi:MAG TPA: YdiU family protein [Polyangiaceae bacterium]|nr:YdiU family protein [Polyangiaceae bacterium]HYQ30773.1 YdiU family protein [Polyangiaceae bacterium]
MPVTIAFDNSYARLPERFFARVLPTRVREPRIIKVNHALAEQLGLDPAQLDSPEGAQVLAGNVLPEGAASIALAYAGHQFGGFSRQLGDGRAILLGEVLDRDGARRDLQLKGAGRTPFSRNGDGRAALGPVLREYIVSEAMAAFGVPTTRALAAVTTGETVLRELPLPGAVLTRVAASHLRVGTFEFFAARDDREALLELTKYTLARHYPLRSEELRSTNSEALRLLDCVIEAQAALVARWLGLGFVHGVMNTDNTSISGETIDYGPCAFLDEYDPGKTFSSIDHGGRYAFANQPKIALWNLARFAETLLPLIADADAEAARLATERLERFPGLFEAAHLRVMRSKLGLETEDAADSQLIDDLLQRLAQNQVDHTVFFRALCAAAQDPAAATQVADLFADPASFHGFAERWRQRLELERAAPEERARSMRLSNPAFIPRNHRIEQAIVAALNDNFVPFETLVSVLARPYEEQPEFAHLAEPPLVSERVRATFCGT